MTVTKASSTTELNYYEAALAAGGLATWPRSSAVMAPKRSQVPSGYGQGRRFLLPAHQHAKCCVVPLVGPDRGDLIRLPGFRLPPAENCSSQELTSEACLIPYYSLALTGLTERRLECKKKIFCRVLCNRLRRRRPIGLFTLASGRSRGPRCLTPEVAQRSKLSDRGADGTHASSPARRCV